MIKPLIATIALALLALPSAANAAEGIAAAKARGVRFGRPQLLVPEHFEQTVRSWEKKEISVQEAVRRCGMSEATFYRRLKEYRTTEKRA